MARQQKRRESPAPMADGERLGLRVSAMIGSPKAQLERRAVIHRLDTDTDRAWDGIMTLLAETDGLALAFDAERSAVVTWEAGEVEEVVEGREELELEEEEAPF